MQLTYIAGWKFSVHRGEFSYSEYLKVAVYCAEINPLFSPLIPLKAFLEIDYTESLPPLQITVAQFPSHFLQSKDMGIYSITVQGAKPEA